MWVKVCGLREPDNIRAVASLGVDFIGFVFCPSDERYVKMINSQAGIIPDYSAERLEKCQAGEEKNAETSARFPQKVGVFADDMPQNIVTRVYNYHLDVVQLNGDESPVMIDNLRRTLDPDIREGIKIIKTLHVRTEEDLADWKRYEGHADLFLFEFPGEGSADRVEWRLLDAYGGGIPFLMGGGISRKDVGSIKAFRHPLFVGVDVNEGFETAPAVKSVEDIRCFVDALK